MTKTSNKVMYFISVLYIVAFSSAISLYSILGLVIKILVCATIVVYRTAIDIINKRLVSKYLLIRCNNQKMTMRRKS